MSSRAALSDFAKRLQRLIVDEPFDDDQFDRLARELFEHQFEVNIPYRLICEKRGVVPGNITQWSKVPAVPSVAFKELDLSCLTAPERTAVFYSSGTTEQRPSRHFHGIESLAIYETSLWKGFGEFLPVAAGHNLAILTPPPAHVPHSSLVHMFDVVRQKLNLSEETFSGKAVVEGGWTIDLESTISLLGGALYLSKPIGVLGTAFSFVQLLDALAGRGLQFHLPPGSWALETGGYKGRSRTLPKIELHELITKQLGIRTDRIICEYGMSELSSQAYDLKIESEERHVKIPTRYFHFPPWARVQIVSPETGRLVADGETGLVRVFDLANVFSVMAVQTEDLAVRRGYGFELVGRAPEAERRGCSLLTVDS